MFMMTFSNPSNNACIYAKTFSMFNVVDYLQAMMFAPHATSKLKELNCDTLRVEKFVAFHPHLMVMFFLSFPLNSEAIVRHPTFCSS
jgi:hypothetical protein